MSEEATSNSSNAVGLAFQNLALQGTKRFLSLSTVSTNEKIREAFDQYCREKLKKWEDASDPNNPANANNDDPKNVENPIRVEDIEQKPLISSRATSDVILEFARIKPAMQFMFNYQFEVDFTEDLMYLLKKRYVDASDGIQYGEFEKIVHLITACKSDFDEADTNKDNKVSYDELVACLDKRGYKLDNSIVKIVWNIFDDNASNSLDFNEFMNVVLFFAEMEEVFAQKDTNHNGTIGADDIVPLLLELKIRSHSETALKQIQRWKQENHAVTFQDFAKILFEEKERSSVVRRLRSHNVTRVTTLSNILRQIKVDYVQKVEHLKRASPKGFMFSPYSMEFSVVKYPLLLLECGENSAQNPDIKKGSLSAKLSKQDHVKQETPVIRIAFIGDIMCLDREMPPTASEKIRKIFRAADLVVVNVEAPVTRMQRDPTIIIGEAIEFDMSIEYLKRICQNLNIDPSRTLFNIANNHIGDEGIHGLKKTVENITAMGGHVIGVATREEHGSRGIICRVDFGDCKVGVVSWTRWMNHNEKNRDLPVVRQEDIEAQNWEEIKKKEELDVLVGFPHWDYEQSFIPSKETSDFVENFVKPSRFNCVVGHGPHVLQPVEVPFGRCVCAYSVGNLCSPRGTWQTKMGAGTKQNKAIKKYTYNPYVQQLVGREKDVVVIPVDESRDDTAIRQKMRSRLEKLFDLTPILSSQYGTGERQIYRVTVVTGSHLGAGTRSRVFISLLGENGNSEEFELKHKGENPFSFRNQVDNFYLEVSQNLGDIKQIQMRLQPKGLFSGNPRIIGEVIFSAWQLARVTILNLWTNKQWLFDCNNHWFDESIKETSLVQIFDRSKASLKNPFNAFYAEFKTGDLIALESTGIASSVLKVVTDSPYSHVGIITVENEESETGKQVYVYECAKENHTRDTDYSEWYEGVHCFTLKDRLDTFPGSVYYFPLHTPIPQDRADELISWLDEQHETKKPFTVPSSLEETFKHLNIRSKYDIQSFFSIELVVGALKQTNVLPWNIPTDDLSVADVVALPCFRKNPIVLKDHNL